METPSACAPDGPGFDIFGYCFVPDPILQGILWAIPVIYGFLVVALRGPKWRKRVRGWLYSGTWSRAYSNLLDGLLRWLDEFFGPPQGLRAFGECFGIALVYTVVYGLALGSITPWDWAFPGEKLNPSTPLATMVLAGIVAFFIFRWLSRSQARACREAKGKRRLWLILREQGSYLIVVGLWLAAIYYFLASANWNDAQITVASVTASIAALLFGAAFGGGPVPATTCASGLLAAFFAGIYGYLDLDLGAEFVEDMFVTFFGIPILNALFDWPSWWASRWLMAQLKDDVLRTGTLNRIRSTLSHVAADLVLAFVCLFGFAIVMAILTSWTGGIATWIGYIVARMEPFSVSGSVMTIMLASTLVPTAIHLFFAVFAFAVLHPPFAARTAFWLQDDQEGTETGTQMLVAVYLTACAAFAMLVLWGAGRLVILALNGLVGGTGIWPLIFETADMFVTYD